MRAPMAAAAATVLLAALVLGVAGQAEPGVVASYGQGRLWLKPYDWTYLRGEIELPPGRELGSACFEFTASIAATTLFGMRICAFSLFPPDVELERAICRSEMPILGVQNLLCFCPVPLFVLC